VHRAGSITTTASASIAPFFVKPKETASTLASVVKARDRQVQAGGCVGQPSAIHVQRQVVAMGDLSKGRHFIRRVDGPHFTGLRNAHRTGLSSMHEVHVEALALYRLGMQFSVRRGDGP
jgi:hypothetical protein